ILALFQFFSFFLNKTRTVTLYISPPSIGRGVQKFRQTKKSFTGGNFQAFLLGTASWAGTLKEC
ncbi:MAG: hypothetical protein ACK5VR_11075, partial [Burkholderiales bacterium]